MLKHWSGSFVIYLEKWLKLDMPDYEICDFKILFFKLNNAAFHNNHENMISWEQFHWNHVKQILLKPSRAESLKVSSISQRIISFIEILSVTFSALGNMLFFFSSYFFWLATFLETVLLVLAYFCRSFLQRTKRPSSPVFSFLHCCSLNVTLRTCSFSLCSCTPVLPPSGWCASLWSSCCHRWCKVFHCGMATTTVQENKCEEREHEL